MLLFNGHPPYKPSYLYEKEISMNKMRYWGQHQSLRNEKILKQNLMTQIDDNDEWLLINMHTEDVLM